MIKKSLLELAKRTFWLIAVVLVLTIPMVLIVGPGLEEGPSFDGNLATSTGWISMAGLVAFTLIVAGTFVFWIFPALLQLGEDILEARKDGKEELFP
jgi:hypothetical protein